MWNQYVQARAEDRLNNASAAWDGGMIASGTAIRVVGG